MEDYDSRTLNLKVVYSKPPVSITLISLQLRQKKKKKYPVEPSAYVYNRRPYLPSRDLQVESDNIDEGTTPSTKEALKSM